MPAQVDTTHTLIPKTLIVYSRERTDIWQCRYKVANAWVRCSTKKTDLEEAKEAARELLYEARAREKSGIPVITRKFKLIAELAIKRLKNEIENDRGLKKHKAYERTLNKYHIPFFGKQLITNIQYTCNCGRFVKYTIAK